MGVPGGNQDPAAVYIYAPFLNFPKLGIIW
jgi:hypothetical protein